MSSWVIEEEFHIHYHPGHVRKLLHAWGFSVQRPRCARARADAAALHRPSQLPAGLDAARDQALRFNKILLSSRIPSQ